MIKMSLDQIRGRIQFCPEIWIHMYTTNCYAYALGLDISENKICLNAYQPGMISNVVKNVKGNLTNISYDLFIKRVESDLDALNINYRNVLPNEEVDEDEWKIILLTEKHDDKLSDFHFLREMKDGKWSHKLGYYGKIKTISDIDPIVSNPNLCDLDFYTYDRCYALSMKKR